MIQFFKVENRPDYRNALCAVIYISTFLPRFIVTPLL